LFSQRKWRGFHLPTWVPGLLETRVGAPARAPLRLFRLLCAAARDGDGALRGRWLPCFASKLVFQTCSEPNDWDTPMEKVNIKSAHHEVGVIARAAKKIPERSKCHTVHRSCVPSQRVKQMPFLNIPNLANSFSKFSADTHDCKSRRP
jgi:hypothetical protein